MREVRDRNDIVSVVGDYVSLRKAGGQSYKGLCPFHKEKTPSFHVHRDRQFFYCFGCQTGGDVITFVRELNGYSFIEALRNLAERVGMQLPERRSGHDGGGGPRRPRASRSQRDRFYAVGARAQRFFVDTLATMEGTACREYLRDRGIDSAGIERFGLGFAPDRWDGLVNTLSAERF
ncbi:MAG: DNA primase, partial [Proteobacteria bacterium]